MKNIKKISDGILDSLKPYNIDEDRAFQIRLCVEEAVRNAMVHGNKSDAKRPVIATWKIAPYEVSIEIEDEGKGFDHKSVPDPTHGENILRNSGRGVYLIKKLMDEVEYMGSGNRVRMTKRLA